MQFKSKTQESAYYQEWAYVQGRTFLLFLLAIGSLLVTFRIGEYLGGLLFPGIPGLVFLTKGAFVFFGYMGIDWVLATALSSASHITDSEVVIIDEDTGAEVQARPSSRKRSVWVFATAALLSTVGLSIVSNLFVSTEMAGQSHLLTYNGQIEQAMNHDSLFKMKAFTMLETAGEEERRQIAEARREKTRLVEAAVASGSASWQEDYQQHKNNPRAWFWVCTSCPRAYRQYRQRIKDAITEGDALIAQAQGYQHNIQASLSPTLTYQLATDTMLAQVRSNILLLESERNRRASLINLILLTLTIGAGVLSLILTYVLREHRKENGQQVSENHVRPIMLVLDMGNRLASTVTDILFTVFAQPFHWLKENGYIKTYQITENRFTDSSNGSVDKRNKHSSDKRICRSCKKDISHKRSDAKYCSDKCRMDFHNYVPGRGGDVG